jgi:hypothetical protein
MRKKRQTHRIWTAAAIASFIVGAQFRAGDEQRPVPPGARSAPRIAADSRVPASEQVPTRGSRRWQSAGGLPAELFNRALVPLTGKEIEEYVPAAIKSPNPLERRRAFDRILREIGSGTFTVEQAMAMRQVLFHNGARREQWRLFDYAWGASEPSSARRRRT